jgi:hypothetical protein
MVLKFFSRFSSVNVRHISDFVTWIALSSTLFRELGKQFWARLLEKLTVRVVVFKRNTVLLHNVIVGKLG